MRTRCIACNGFFFYRDGDEDCTTFVCSFCIGANPQTLADKWARLRFRILNRDEFKCRYCGNSPMKDNACILHIDHVRPVSDCGTNAETNLITACALCNFGKLHFSLTPKSKIAVDEYLKSRQEKLNESDKAAS